MKRIFKKPYDPKKDPLVQFTEDGGAVIQLVKSIKSSQKEGAPLISELTFHAPLVEDVEAQGLAEHEMQQSRYLVASLSGLPVATLRKMQYKDFERCALTAKALTDGDQGNDEPDESESENSDDE